MILSNLKLILRPIFLFGSIVALLLSQSSYAIDNLFPTNNDVTNPIPISMDDTITVASQSGTSYQLNSDEVSFKVYHATDSTPTVTIHYACSPYNFGGPTTTFEFWRLNTNENTVVDESGNAGLQPLATFTNSSCNSGNNIVFTYSSALNRSAVPGRTNYYVGLVKAVETGGGSTGSINGFKVSIATGFVTFRNLSDNSDIYNSGSPTVFKAFALLSNRFGDRSNATDLEDDFMFDFSPDCNMPNNRRVYLKWSDADVGRSNEGSAGIQFRLFNITTNSYVSLTNYAGAATGSAVGGSELMNGNVGVNDAYGEASFIAQRHHKYRWIWENVDDNNGIQFWAPFSELNFARNDCPTTSNISATCSAVSGTVVEPEAPSDSVPIRVGVRLGTSGTWTWANLTASPNFSYTIPASFKSSSQPTQIIVQKRLPTSNPTIWGIWTSTNNSGPSEPCVGTPPPPPPEPKYDIKVVPVDPSGASNAAPGVSVPASFTISNEPNGHNSADGPTPPSPTYRIRQSNTYLDGTSVTYPINDAGTVINSGGSISRAVNIAIPSDAQIGQVYCVSLLIERAWGLSDGLDSDLGRREGPKEVCVTLSDGPYFQVWDNDVWAGGGFDTSADGSDATCTAVDSSNGEIRSHRSDSNNIGAGVEYGAFAWGAISGFRSALNRPDIPTFSSTELTFSNKPTPPGQFKADRCLKRFFDSGIVDGGVDETDGGVINDDLWNGSDGNLPSADLNLTVDGYQYTSGDLTITDSLDDSFQKSTTILVNGDLNINSEIEFIYYADTTPGNYPSLVFVVSGDVFIHPSIEHVDAVIITHGIIDTCAFSSDLAAQLSINVGCEAPLKMNGPIAANNIAFRRTSGGLNQAINDVTSNCAGATHFLINADRRCAAEQFSFPVSLYVAEIVLKYDSGRGNADLPIQQIRDLPPVY